MKKIFTHFVALVVVALTFAPQAKAAADVASGTCGPDVNWRITADSTLIIYGSGAMNDNSSPWSSHSKSIAYLEIHPGVTHIGSYAFDDCEFKGSLSIPTGVTSIGNSAFYRSGYKNFSGTLLSLPETLNAIGDNAFHNCGFTGTLSLPDDLESIGAGAFEECNGLTGSLTIPGSVGVIGKEAFRLCSGFDGQLVIQDGVGEIGNSAFYGCDGFKGSLSIPGSVKSIGTSAFGSCEGFTGTLTIGDGVEVIGGSAFRSCNFTGSLTIPSSVKRIGDSAFEFCEGLTGELALPDDLQYLGSSAFRDCKGLTGELDIPTGISAIYDGTFNGCSGFTGSLVIPANVDSIGNEAFMGCTGFSGVLELHKDVVCIGYSAFKNCNCFDHLVIHATTPPVMLHSRYSSNNAFSYSGITVAYVPTGTAQAYRDAWSDKTGVIVFVDDAVDITVDVATPGDLTRMIRKQGYTPDQVNRITITGTLDFTDWRTLRDRMPQLVSVDLSGLTNTTMPDSTFYRRTSINSVILPAGLTAIPERAFQLGNLKGEFAFPASVASIRDYAFYGCDNLKGSLVLPEGLDSIGVSAFRDCEDITGALNLPAGMVYIGSHAFGDCTGFTGSLIVPDGITKLEGCFYGCTGLEGEFITPRSLKSINADAIDNTRFTSVEFGENLATIPYNLFDNPTIQSITCRRIVPPSVSQDFTNIDPKTCKLTVPVGTEESYWNAKVWTKFMNTEESAAPAPEYLVTVKAANGVVTDDAGKEIRRKVLGAGDDLQLTLLPDVGYRLASLTVGGVDCTDKVATDGTFVIEDIQTAVAVEASFDNIRYTVSVYTVGSGVVTSFKALYEADTEVSIVAEDDHTISTVVVEGVDMTDRLTPEGVLLLEKVSEDTEIVITMAGGGTTVKTESVSEQGSVTSWTVDGSIFLSSAAEMAEVEVFDMSGKAVATVRPRATACSIPVPEHTAYLLRVSTATGATHTLTTLVP